MTRLQRVVGNRGKGPGGVMSGPGGSGDGRGRAAGTDHPTLRPGGPASRRRPWSAVALTRPEPTAGSSGQDGVDGLAVDVGQAAVDAVVVVGQPLVVDAEELQHGGVQVV